LNEEETEQVFDFEAKTVLVIAPHPDDEAFGCGGLIHRLKANGSKVYVLYVTVGTTADFSLRGRSSAAERIAEVEQVAAFLRLDGYTIALPGDEHHLRLDALPRKELLDVIERGSELSLERLRPDVVLAPSGTDYNQDHQAISEATMTALRPGAPEHKSFQPVVLTYELPCSQWNLADSLPCPGLYVRLDAQALRAKLTAVELYRSQLKSPRSPLSVRGAEVLAAYRGLQCGAVAAEAFHIKRLVA
jgi:LmbE family N-acetylglucosaminyl deacetylase